MKKTIKKISSYQWKRKGNNNNDPLDQTLVIRYYNNNNILLTKEVDAYEVDDLIKKSNNKIHINPAYIDVIERGYEEGDFTLVDLLIEIQMCYLTILINNNNNYINDYQHHDIYVKLSRLAHKYNLDSSEPK
jgi:hypothetical protein